MNSLVTVVFQRKQQITNGGQGGPDFIRDRPGHNRVDMRVIRRLLPLEQALFFMSITQPRYQCIADEFNQDLADDDAVFRPCVNVDPAPNHPDHHGYREASEITEPANDDESNDKRNMAAFESPCNNDDKEKRDQKIYVFHNEVMNAFIPLAIPGILFP